MEFLSTLKVVKSKKDVMFNFWFFNEPNTLNLDDLISALGFETRKAVIDLDKLRDFSGDDF